MIRLALAALALAACIDDHYECTRDDDCNVGLGGRCELDRHCTAFDIACPLQRRYTEHSGAVSNQCFADSAVPIDPCASGQPPAPADTTDACAASVCAALPSCCTTAWSDACVQLAQVACTDLRCDTRIAITAENTVVPGTTPPAPILLDLRITGRTATYTRVDSARAAFLGWLAPARGAGEPRLASLDSTRANLLVDAAIFPLATDRSYDGAASLDFDRSGRDHIVISSYAVTDGQPAQLLDLETSTSRALALGQDVPVATWGDADDDPFPDLLSGSTTRNAYTLVHNVDSGAPGFARALEFTWSAMTGGVQSGSGETQLASFQWGDFDGDHELDAVELGAEAHVHFFNDSRPDRPHFTLDCSPIVSNNTCNGVELAGAAVPSPTATQLVLALDDGTRTLYPFSLANRTLTAQAPITGPPCAGCAPIRALVARDLDGDHVLDIVAIDGSLAVYVKYGNGKTLMVPPPAGTTLAAPVKVVRTSVSGAITP